MEKVKYLCNFEGKNWHTDMVYAIQKMNYSC
jgi:hypothetical protein